MYDRNNEKDRDSTTEIETERERDREKRLGGRARTSEREKNRIKEVSNCVPTCRTSFKKVAFAAAIQIMISQARMIPLPSPRPLHLTDICLQAEIP